MRVFGILILGLFLTGVEAQDSGEIIKEVLNVYKETIIEMQQHRESCFDLLKNKSTEEIQSILPHLNCFMSEQAWTYFKSDSVGRKLDDALVDLDQMIRDRKVWEDKGGSNIDEVYKLHKERDIQAVKNAFQSIVQNIRSRFQNKKVIERVGIVRAQALALASPSAGSAGTYFMAKVSGKMLKLWSIGLGLAVSATYELRVIHNSLFVHDSIHLYDTAKLDHVAKIVYDISAEMVGYFSAFTVTSVGAFQIVEENDYQTLGELGSVSQINNFIKNRGLEKCFRGRGNRNRGTDCLSLFLRYIQKNIDNLKGAEASKTKVKNFLSEFVGRVETNVAFNNFFQYLTKLLPKFAGKGPFALAVTKLVGQASLCLAQCETKGSWPHAMCPI